MNKNKLINKKSNQIKINQLKKYHILKKIKKFKINKNMVNLQI